MLGKVRHIHFVGIGGIGMSGIAEVLLNLGFTVSGSDIEESAITRRLAGLGATVCRGHAAGNIAGADALVVSSAVGADNPEVAAASAAGLPVIPRSDMLGELMRIRTAIAVAGAHGKTTTTSLAAVVLQEAGFDPTIIVGGRVKSLDATARLGAGRYLVAEVDESDGNFVRLSPTIALITNIDAEHLECYGDLQSIQEAFVVFANRVPFHGVVIVCLDDAHARAAIPGIDRRIVTYGFGPEADVRGEILSESSEGSAFRLLVDGAEAGELFLRIPGRHNVLNALGVCALAAELEIPFEALRRAFGRFQGVGRRFERRGEEGGVLVMDDYGHHPTEIAAAVATARRAFDRRLVVVFQPHRYTRTRDLHERFDRCFREADEVLITDVYAAGETPIPWITGELIYRAARRGGARRVTYLPDRGSLIEALSGLAREGDLVLTLGAGDIWTVGDELLERRRTPR
ncbi:MAG: UDP-N-acetylmuramate--L-alanine ligase [Candidatus Krumholzibacteria bacterium]|nr:UDP-N-acetylmuramate--L-alanine ligase [Candidatus Krumholzibacteria bacterium]